MSMLGEMIRAKRMALQITQAELSAELGLDSPMFISQIENGWSKAPLKTLGKLCAILQLPRGKVIAMLVKEYRAKLLAEMGE